jgi:phosphatidylglycerol---prolipoprotein diacylglyceryl transferase
VTGNVRQRGSGWILRLPRGAVWIRRGRYRLVSFGFFAALGGAAGTWVSLAWQAVADVRLPGVLFFSFPWAVLIGSRLFCVLEGLGRTRANGRALGRAFFGFYGGFAVCTLLIALVATGSGVPVLAATDVVSLGIPIGHAIGRVGCLFYGCCHGREAQHGPAVRYEDPEAKVSWCSQMSGVPLHPTQLYEALAYLLVFSCMVSVAMRGTHPGELTSLYLMGSALARFSIEWLRHQPRDALGFTSNQHIAAVLFAAGLAIWHGTGLQPALPQLDGVWQLAAVPPRALWSVWTFAVLLLGFGLQGRETGSLPAAIGWIRLIRGARFASALQRKH